MNQTFQTFQVSESFGTNETLNGERRTIYKPKTKVRPAQQFDDPRYIDHTLMTTTIRRERILRSIDRIKQRALEVREE